MDKKPSGNDIYSHNLRSNNPNISGNSLNRKESYLNKMEKRGYIYANRLHKVAVLSMVAFIIGNIGILLYKYNRYWKMRRDPNYHAQYQ